MQAQPAWESTLLDRASAPLAAAARGEHCHTDAQILNAAYAACDQMTRYHSRTFYIASALLPAEKRRAVRALYAFCRLTDDTVDRVNGSPQGRRDALEAWRLQALANHPANENHIASVVLAWSDARNRYHIPTGYAEQLIDGVARDLTQTRYSTFDELAAYSYGVASTVGLMAMHIIGFTGEEALPYAVKLGVALQVTNILRDVAEDWNAGRLYLPADELAAYQLDEAAIDCFAQTGLIDDRWRGFMRFQIARNRQLYTEGSQGIRLLNRDGRFAIAAAADLYRAILNEIEALDYNVFTHRASVGTVGKVKRLPRIWLGARR